jgi:hypothetical protein
MYGGFPIHAGHQKKRWVVFLMENAMFLMEKPGGNIEKKLLKMWKSHGEAAGE